jgi:YfiH family protein
MSDAARARLPPNSLSVPDWHAPPGVRACFTLREGGVSRGPWGGAASGAGGLNLGAACGDEPDAVAENRARVARALPAPPLWLQQVHGVVVHEAQAEPLPDAAPPAADAVVTCEPGVVCAVLVADCLPVLLADARGRAVGAVHAGWRGLAGGVIEASVARLRALLGEPEARLVAWLGPCIGPTAFEVGGDVLDAMRVRLPQAQRAFASRGPGKYLADLPALARQALASCGVEDVAGGADCTYSDPRRHFSYRRDGRTGRHAALIWIDPR